MFIPVAHRAKPCTCFVGQIIIGHWYALQLQNENHITRKEINNDENDIYLGANILPAFLHLYTQANVIIKKKKIKLLIHSDTAHPPSRIQHSFGLCQKHDGKTFHVRQKQNTKFKVNSES